MRLGFDPPLNEPVAAPHCRRTGGEAEVLENAGTTLVDLAVGERHALLPELTDDSPPGEVRLVLLPASGPFREATAPLHASFSQGIEGEDTDSIEDPSRHADAMIAME